VAGSYSSALRNALAENGDGQSWIVTVPGRGYRLLRSLEPWVGHHAADAPVPAALR
jgi:DNA-binding winged helix-turn-helix (wHTH) protein